MAKEGSNPERGGGFEGGGSSSGRRTRRGRTRVKDDDDEEQVLRMFFAAAGAGTNARGGVLSRVKLRARASRRRAVNMYTRVYSLSRAALCFGVIRTATHHGSERKRAMWPRAGCETSKLDDVAGSERISRRVGPRVAYRGDRGGEGRGARGTRAAYSSALSVRAHPSHDGFRHRLRRLPFGASSRVLSTGDAVRSRARRRELSAELAPTRGTNNQPSAVRASDPTPSRLPRPDAGDPRAPRLRAPRRAQRRRRQVRARDRPRPRDRSSRARPAPATTDAKYHRPIPSLPLHDSSPRSSPLAADPPPGPAPRSAPPPFAPPPPSPR